MMSARTCHLCLLVGSTAAVAGQAAATASEELACTDCATSGPLVAWK